jgi:hypothetical protein
MKMEFSVPILCEIHTECMAQHIYDLISDLVGEQLPEEIFLTDLNDETYNAIFDEVIAELKKFKRN